MAWQLQEAQQRLDELIRRALSEGPQVVTRQGEDVVVVLSVAEFQRLSRPNLDFKEFLLSGPDLSELDLVRSPELPRPIEY